MTSSSLENIEIDHQIRLLDLSYYLRLVPSSALFSSLDMPSLLAAFF